MSATQARIGLRSRHRLVRLAVFLGVALFLGWFYGWASPWCYPRQGRAGFGYGLLHGALMPMALPSLVMGRDVEIYAPTNSGRSYKLGYIVGINCCGLIFFGSAFWRPHRSTCQRPPREAPR
ncbi:MAG: hypothetical protein KGS61_05585 [Verrucomicrobia bacterium]|nr:hypothetical protein [Verrucomicrobiota bacterium]